MKELSHEYILKIWLGKFYNAWKKYAAGDRTGKLEASRVKNEIRKIIEERRSK